MVWLLGLSGPAPTDAAPHTVRNVEHPFDADWPDVCLVLFQKCAGCHRPGTDRTDLTSYRSLLAAQTDEGRPLIVPGRPEQSPLWRQIVWNHTGDRRSPLPREPEMPMGDVEHLTGRQLSTIHRWIRGGCLEHKPAGIRTAGRPLLEIDFPSAKECRACHPRQFEQWSRSMHAYAEHSPIFEAFNLTLIERTGGTIGTFCTRCHTPLGTSLGENGSRRNVHRSRLSMEGVTCVVCHRRARPYYKSNTRAALVGGTLRQGCLFGPFDDPASVQTKTHPSAGRPFLKTSAFCGTCHNVTSPAGVRLEEAYSEWQNSPAAKQEITCQQCHMGPSPGLPVADDQRPLGRAATVPGVDPKQLPLRHLTDHTFAGPDYSLLPDTEFPETLDWMYETDYRDVNRLTAYQRKTLTDLRRRNRRQLRIASQKRYELLGNSAEIAVDVPETAVAGRRLDVCVAVTNKVSGHNFPTGFTAERQAWVEVRLRDPSGRTVFHSGDVDHNGDLRNEHSHEVEAGTLSRDRYLLNFQSKFVALTNRGTERPVVLPVNRHLTPLNVLRPATGIPASFGRPPTFRVSKSSIPPLATVRRTYPIWLPRQEGNYSLRVRLNFRHLPAVLLDRIGTPHLKHLIETVVIDEQRAVIRVSRR